MSPEGAEGSCFAEYDVTVARRGRVSTGSSGRRDRRRHGRHPGERRSAENGCAAGGESRRVARRGWLVGRRHFPAATPARTRCGWNTNRVSRTSRSCCWRPIHCRKGSPVPQSNVQIARQYGINPGYLDHWVEELRRSKGAPHSVLFAWYAYQAQHSLDEKSLSGWTSPAAKLFEGFHPKTRRGAGRTLSGIVRTKPTRQWQALRATLPAGEENELDETEDPATKNEKQPVLADAGLEALRELAVRESRAVPRSRRCQAVLSRGSARADWLRIEKERKELEDSTPDLPRAMGVTEGAKIGDLADPPSRQPLDAGRRWCRAASSASIAGEKQPPFQPDQSGRLQFAQWLTEPDHPLTSRVMANRIWRWHFGRGIVPIGGQLRTAGRAAHQSAAARLAGAAVRRAADGRSKQMHRLMMLSNTYQMSSNYDENAAEVDPENTLLWRMNRRRLEAEAIRDAIMAVSGRSRICRRADR